MCPAQGPGRFDVPLEIDPPCPNCAAPLKGVMRLKRIPFGLALFPPRLTCENCGAVFELAQSGSGSVQIGELHFVRIEAGEGN